MKKYQSFLSEIFQFLEVKFSLYLNRHVFVMVEHLRVHRKEAGNGHTTGKHHLMVRLP